jgi:hypothetical protein
MTNTIAPILTSKNTVSILTRIKKATLMRPMIPPRNMRVANTTGKTKPTIRLCYIRKRQTRLDQILTNTQMNHILCLHQVLLRILHQSDGGRRSKKYNYSMVTWSSIAQFHLDYSTKSLMRNLPSAMSLHTCDIQQQLATQVILRENVSHYDKSFSQSHGIPSSSL